jgi:hypothetical protein
LLEKLKNMEIAELVVREIMGEHLSGAEEARVKAWAQEAPARARLLSCLRSAQWRMQEWNVYKDVDKQAVWARMQARVASRPGEPTLPELEHADWLGDVSPAGPRGHGAGRVGKLWAMIVALAALFFEKIV